MSAQDKPASSYRPSAFYFRKALREAATVEQAREIGLQVVRELEMVKAWVRGQGLIPPRQFITAEEAIDKNLIDQSLVVIPFSPPPPSTPQPKKQKRRSTEPTT